MLLLMEVAETFGHDLATSEFTRSTG
jgi:hypothetical protein